MIIRLVIANATNGVLVPEVNMAMKINIEIVISNLGLLRKNSMQYMKKKPKFSP